MSQRHGPRYREHRVRTSLQGVTAPNSDTMSEWREKARALWREFGILIVWPDQNVGGWPEQALRDNIGTRLYGPRRRNG